MDAVLRRRSETDAGRFNRSLTACVSIVARADARKRIVALSVGGGVDFTLWRGLAAGPNITFMKFIGGADDIDLTRIGVRTTYRF